MEPDEYFTIKILILHSLSQTPNINAIGKIAGVKNISITNLVQKEKGSNSFIQSTFGGSIASQFVRTFSYTSLFIITMVLILVSRDKILSFLRKKKRLKIISDFKKKKNYIYNKTDEVVFKKFEIEGAQTLITYAFYLKDELKLNNMYNNWRTNIQSNNNNNNQGFHINVMISDGYLVRDQDKLIINQQMKIILSQFIDYLKAIRYIKSHK